MDTLAFIPSPSAGEVQLGPFPLRGYALCIIIGVFVAVWLGGRRWVARGGRPGTVADIAVWAVPFGLIGGRLYHVVTDYQLYFGDGQNWVDAFRVWDGGLGIWGAIALGAVGAWIGCRRRGIALPAYADAVAPGIALAQAVGRWGNWFNQELFGRPTDVPWAVKIDEEHRPLETPGAETYHPTFLYESLWCVAVALLVIWAGRRFAMGHGRAFALYVAGYTAGRFWIEYLRVDEAHELLGLRLNNYTSIGVFLAAVVYIVVSARLRPGRETVLEPLAERAEASGAARDGKESATADLTKTEDGGSAQASTADPTADPTETTDGPDAGRADDEPATDPAPDSASDPATAGPEDAPSGGEASDTEQRPEAAPEDGSEPAEPAAGRGERAPGRHR